MTHVTQQITGQLIPKRVAAYMKQSHKVNGICVERCQDGSFFLSDNFLIVKVMQSGDLFPYTFFEQGWQRASFQEKDNLPIEGGPYCQALWEREGSHEFKQLTLTDELKEIPGARNKPGTFYRKLTWENQLLCPVYLDKRFTDMFSPDLDELQGFLFEGRDKHQPVRISASNGIVAYVMPMYQKD